MKSAWSARWLAIGTVSACHGAVNFSYDKGTRVWTLANEVATARFELTPANLFRLQSFGQAGSDAAAWTTDPNRISTPIRFTLDKAIYGAATHWTLASQNVSCTTTSACTQSIVLIDGNKTVQVRLDLYMYSGQPILRHAITVTNLKSTSGFMTLAD